MLQQVKRFFAALAVTVLAFGGMAAFGAPATASPPVVTPGAFCAKGELYQVRIGHSGQNYQCQDRDGLRWVPIEPCPKETITIQPVPKGPAVVAPEAKPDKDKIKCFPRQWPPKPTATATRPPTKAPATAPPGTGGGTGSDDDSLPVTGSQVGAMVAGGVGALALGGALMFVARRRQQTV